MDYHAPLYDIPRALRELDQYRATGDNDPVAQQSLKIADDLARHMARQFPDEKDHCAAGSALIIAAASLMALRDIPLEVICNVTGLAGQSLYQGRVI